VDVGAILNTAALLLSIIALTVSTIFAHRQLATAKTSNLTLVTIELLTRECRTDEFLESEDYVLNKLSTEHKPDRGVAGLPFSARKHVLRIGLYYSGLGMMSVFRAVDDKLLIATVSYRVRKAWSILCPYIMAERELRKGTFLSYFEHLASMAFDMDVSSVQKILRLRRVVDSSESEAQPTPH
jgi:hypothetical protein